MASPQNEKDRKIYYILCINPGSTSTKIALYKNKELVFKENIEHSQQELEKHDGLLQQIPMREALVVKMLEAHGFKPEDLSIVMGRGGLFPPMHTGGYKVNQRMLDMVLKEEIYPHASNLGAVLAAGIAKAANINAYVYDAISAADFPPIAKITGMKEVVRESICHVLNSRAAAIRYAEGQRKQYKDMDLIVAHLGGGISVSAHKKGKIVDSLSDNNGPFAPERSGSIPIIDVIELCYSGEYTKDEMIKKVRGLGGLRDLLGTSDVRKINQMIQDGDEYAALVMHAQAYQIAKGICLLFPALKDGCEAIILTGGVANDASLVNETKEYVSLFAPVVVMPGEFEMEALAYGGLRILEGEEDAWEFNQASEGGTVYEKRERRI
jgi:butyrate kinase